MPNAQEALPPMALPLKHFIDLIGSAVSLFGESMLSTRRQTLMSTPQEHVHHGLQ
jgi:hypothetical protein